MWYRNISMCVLLCSVAQSCPALCNPMNLLPPRRHEEPARFLCPWDSLGKNTGLGCHFLLQGIAPTQGSNSRLLHWPAVSLSLSHLGSPMYRNTVHCKNFCNLLAAKNSTEDIFRMRWWEASGSHNLALLSFNYDKLFTMKAVLRHINPLTPWKNESESDKPFIHNFTIV